METISVKSEGGKMDCLKKTLRLVESLEKRLGTAATADDRANFRQFRRFARWNISLLWRGKRG